MISTLSDKEIKADPSMRPVMDYFFYSRPYGLIINLFYVTSMPKNLHSPKLVGRAPQAWKTRTSMCPVIRYS